MTAPKPPDQKTLVGLPNELKAILERPRTAPPPLPGPRTAAAAQDQPLPLPTSGKGGMDRTLIGIPSEMQAALERALAEQGAGVARPARPRPAPRPQPTASEPVEPPPAAASSVLRVQAVRTIGVSSAEPQKPQPAPKLQLKAGDSTRRSVPPPQQLPPRPAARSNPPPQQLPPRPTPRSNPPKLPSQQLPPRESRLTSQKELLAQSQITSQPFLAPNAPLDWPPAQRLSDPGMSLRLDTVDRGGAMQPVEQQRNDPARTQRSQPIAAEPSVIVAPHHDHDQHDQDEPEPEDPQQTALASIDHNARRIVQEAYNSQSLLKAAAQRPTAKLPRGSANTKTKRTKAVVDSPSPKRWPAIALIAVALVAFACVILLRAPGLLPAPLAALVAPAPTHGAGENGDSNRASAAAVAAVAPKPVASDTSAASDPSYAAPAPNRPLASPPFTSGVSAQLEKKAIELLIANDLAAAKPLYEKLRSAEPTRPEYGVMIEILSRMSGGACGQPGQPACTGGTP